MAKRLDDTEDRPPRAPPSRGRVGRVRGRAAGPRPDRPAQAGHLGGRGRGVAVRPVLGGAAPAGPALPDHLPGRHPGHDPARLPAPDPGRQGHRRGARGGRRQPGAARLGPGRPGPGRAALPAGGVRRVRPPGRPAHRPGRGPGGGRGPAGAGGDPAHRRLGAARHLPRLRGLRLPRRPAPLRLGAGPQGVRPGAPGRPGLHGDRGAVRGPPGRGRHLHRAVHHLRGGAGVLGGRPVLHRRQLRRLRDPVGGRPRPHRHPGRVPARHRLRVGGGDHGHPGVGGLAGAAPGRLPAQPGRRGPVGGRDRGHPVPADPGRGRLHHRRVPGDLLPAGAAVRDHPDAALLPGHHPGHRDGQPPLRHPRGRHRHQAAGLAAAALRLLLQLADPDRGLHGRRAVAVPGRAVRHRGRLRPRVPAPRDPLDAPAGVRLPGRRHPGGPAGGGGVRRRRGDRGRGLADRAGPQGQLADRRRGRRHPGPGRALLGRGRPRPGAGRAGDGVVHHLGGDRRPGPGRARGRPRRPPTCSSSTTRCCPR